MRPTFTTGQAARVRQHDRHLQEDAEEVADVVGAVLQEALGAVAALQQEAVAGRDVAERALQLARLAGEHERREGGELTLDIGERRLVGVVGHLEDRHRPPAVGDQGAAIVTTPFERAGEHRRTGAARSGTAAVTPRSMPCRPAYRPSTPPRPAARQRLAGWRRAADYGTFTLMSLKEPTFTFGIEEEYHLVDLHSRNLASGRRS